MGNGGNQQTQQSNGGNQQTQQYKPSSEEQPVAYTGKHIPNMATGLLAKIIDCVADCKSDCGMFSVNAVYFDGVLDLNFPCLDKCMEGKEQLCSNVAMCQSKC